MNAIPMSDDEPDRHYRQIARAIRYLSEHYLEQPDLDAAASVAGISPFHFQRVFSRYVGISPKSFVGSLTLDHAKRQLVAGTSVLDAALSAGLSGPSRLHDLCLKIEAMTPGEYARGGAGLDVDYGLHPSPFGTALLMATEKGLCGLAFADDGEEASALADMKERWPRANYRERPTRTGAFARKIFDSTAAGPTPIELHLSGTPWQVKVWQALLAIPYGEVTSYGAIAGLLANGKGARAVGAAVGRNPISYLIPCHRVLSATGALHGYHWGLARKRAMLAFESARAQDRADNPRTSAIV